MRGLTVTDPGPSSTIQDTGRAGYAALGVGRSGAADGPAAALANRLVANPPGAAVVESTLGGVHVRAHGRVTVAVTGAPCPLTVAVPDASSVHGAAMNTVLHLADGATLRLGRPTRGLRSYLALRGGIDVPPVLGSRSTDLLAGLGPPALAPGTWLPAGPPPAAFPRLDSAPVPEVPDGSITLRAVLGPRCAWFTHEAHASLRESGFTVTPRSNRIGLRLDGPELPRARGGELPSEGMMPGSLQVPPGGEPVLFLADHPVTGGYPVLAVVHSADLPRAAQAPPGCRLRFRIIEPASAEGAVRALPRPR
ncbi:biotin-dependent carboxyltransferase family protein [Lipingzhangella sp. LS1_29]|uniref:Biotin-dependent carboxyltransferase family protein n=1 Tax=Lipingzhangella rawalii TaxID=2055835 RepID=A0ABU2H4B0_9ACTN|nr:biotin-dependent carboxyltransferase family protein [Lipingzhangella rawalii]MDS1270149.1 biotin-dependent carboxyltransferase family protein [Lipingzhangella rawalii]